jgi:imidazolonepropionase-like amidohydrolase
MCRTDRPGAFWAERWRALRARVGCPQPTVPVVAPLAVRPATPGAPPAPLALVNGLLIDGTGAAPVANASVLIQDGRIQRVEAGDRGAIPAGGQVIDVRGATILPGLINAHVHYAYDIARLKTWAQAGVTTVRELGVIVPGESLEQRYILRDNSWVDPQITRIVAASLIISTPKGYGFLFVTSPEEARRVALQALDDGAEQIKFAFENYRFPLNRWPMLPLAPARALVRAAHERGVRALVHITHAKHVELALEAGADEIVHMPYDKLPDTLIRRAVEAGVLWHPTLELYAVFGKSTLSRFPGVDTKYYITRGAMDNLRRIVAAGGIIALGTDYGGTPGTFQDGLPMLELELMQEAGMTPQQILVAATQTAAFACGKLDQLGTVAPGKIADMLVVQGNPLDDLHALQNVRLVIKGGTIIRDEA